MKISRKEIYKMTENNKNDSENIHDHMKNLEKLVGFTTLKLKNARVGGNRAGYDIVEDDDASDEVVYKSPVAERDENTLKQIFISSH